MVINGRKEEDGQYDIDGGLPAKTWRRVQLCTKAELPLPSTSWPYRWSRISVGRYQIPITPTNHHVNETFFPTQVLSGWIGESVSR